MNRLLKSLLIVSFVLGASAPSFAQVPIAQAPSPTTAPSVTGTVRQYLLTPHGEVDGVLLTDGTVVKFPPHLGDRLTATIKRGDPVAVVGFIGLATPYGTAMKALTITNTVTGQGVVDEPPAAPPLPPDRRGLSLTPLTVTGTVVRLLVTPPGDVDGLLLSSGEQVKFPPHNGALVATLLGRPGGTVTATGFGTRNAFGTVVDADSLVVNGQQVSLRGPGRPPRPR